MRLSGWLTKFKRNREADVSMVANASPIVAGFICAAKDLANESDRRELRKHRWPLLTASSSSATEEARLFRLMDWVVRYVAPITLEILGGKDEADLLRGLNPVVDGKTSANARKALFLAIKRNGARLRGKPVEASREFEIDEPDSGYGAYAARYAHAAADVSTIAATYGVKANKRFDFIPECIAIAEELLAMKDEPKAAMSPVNATETVG